MLRPLLLAAALLATPALASDLPSLGEAETVSAGHLGLEGPVAAEDGSIFFSDVSAAKILRYDPAIGETETLDPDSGGANGLDFSPTGLVRCEGRTRRLTLTPTGEPDAEPTVLAERFDGDRFNTPNDLIVLPAEAGGGLFFSDPRYGPRDTMEMEAEAVYAVAAPLEPGAAITRVIDDLVRPNGVTTGPDARTLYVADEGARKVYAYDIVPGSEGTPPGVANRRLFADVADHGNPDGMVADAAGRLYVALFETGQLLVLSPDGKPLALTPTGERSSNVCLDPDERFAYVTAGGSLVRVPLDTTKPASVAPSRD